MKAKALRGAGVWVWGALGGRTKAAPSSMRGGAYSQSAIRHCATRERGLRAR
jgi:hypothetical protein